MLKINNRLCKTTAMVWSCEEDVRRKTTEKSFRIDSTREEAEGKTYNYQDGNDEEKRMDGEKKYKQLFQVK